MSYLKWDLDTENGIDVIDPMGDLYIIGDEGQIVEKFTNLDIFFEALVEAAQSIRIGKSIIVDPIVEPNDLHFNYHNDTLEITYGQQKTTIINADRFIEDIREAVNKLLEILDKQSKLEKQPRRKLTILREYLTVKASLIYKAMFR